jgi:hypothetical protein
MQNLRLKIQQGGHKERVPDVKRLKNVVSATALPRTTSGLISDAAKSIKTLKDNTAMMLINAL